MIIMFVIFHTFIKFIMAVYANVLHYLEPIVSPVLGIEIIFTINISSID